MRAIIITIIACAHSEKRTISNNANGAAAQSTALMTPVIRHLLNIWILEYGTHIWAVYFVTHFSFQTAHPHVWSEYTRLEYRKIFVHDRAYCLRFFFHPKHRAKCVNAHYTDCLEYRKISNSHLFTEPSDAFEYQNCTYRSIIIRQACVSGGVCGSVYRRHTNRLMIDRLLWWQPILRKGYNLPHKKIIQNYIYSYYSFYV